MQFLILTERRMDLFPAEAWTPDLIALEANRVRELYTEGFIRSIWRRKDKPGAAILMEAASQEEALTQISTLPLAERGMLNFAVVTQLEPYPGFAPR
jgi:muconolactone delta-isomerase